MSESNEPTRQDDAEANANADAAKTAAAPAWPARSAAEHTSLSRPRSRGRRKRKERRPRHPGLRIEQTNAAGEVVVLQKPRQHREKRVRAALEGEAREAHPDASEERILELVDDAYEREFPTDPNVAKEYMLLAPSVKAPPSRDIYQSVEVHGIRQTSEMHELEQSLAVLPQQPGPRPGRKLPIATFLRNCLEAGRCDVLNITEDLYRVKNDPVCWSYDWPATEPMHLANIYRQMQSMLDFRDPGICMDLNVRAFLKLREEVGDKDMGRYLVIDGTDVPAPLDQHKAINDTEEAVVRRGFADAEFGSHGESKWWRGYLLVTITDVKSTKPLGFAMLRSTEPERSCLDRLLKQIGALWEKHSGEPWEPEYLCGDGHFNTEAVNRLLEECYGIHPVFRDPGGHDSTKPFASTSGVPHCSKHGPMKLIQSEGFVDAKKRRKLGLRFGEAADLSDAIFRWACDGVNVDEHGDDEPCQIQARTRWDDKPRLYPYLPYGGRHKNRVAKRTAIEIRRNASESINARLKHRGIANGKSNVTRWISTRRQTEWLCFTALLSMTLQQYACETGLYEESKAEADAEGYLTASLPTVAQLMRLQTQKQRRAARGKTGRSAASLDTGAGADHGEMQAAAA